MPLTNNVPIDLSGYAPLANPTFTGNITTGSPILPARFFTGTTTLTSIADGTNKDSFINFPTGFTDANCVLIGIVLVSTTSGSWKVWTYGSFYGSQIWVGVQNATGSTQNITLRYTIMRTDI